MPALLGLTAGFGLWFTYVYALTLLALVLFLASHQTGKFLRPLLTWGALGFAVGFSPWVVINLHTRFAGLAVGDSSLWDHFGLRFLLADLPYARRLGLVQGLFTFASEDPWRLYRWTANLAYFILFASPVVTAVLSFRNSGPPLQRSRRRPPTL